MAASRARSGRESRAAAAPDRKWRGAAAAGFVDVDEVTLRENEAWAGWVGQQHLYHGLARCWEAGRGRSALGQKSRMELCQLSGFCSRYEKQTVL